MGVTRQPQALEECSPGEEVGRHALLDLYGVSSDTLKDACLFSRLLLEAAQAAGASPLSDPVIHVFPGGGLTAFVPLSESHIAVHSYPERGYLAADIFTCGNCSLEVAVEVLIRGVRPSRQQTRILSRGV